MYQFREPAVPGDHFPLFSWGDSTRVTASLRRATQMLRQHGTYQTAARHDLFGKLKDERLLEYEGLCTTGEGNISNKCQKTKSGEHNHTTIPLTSVTVKTSYAKGSSCLHGIVLCCSAKAIPTFCDSIISAISWC